MANILVTGGAGYIGSHVVRELLRANHTVSVIDHFSTEEKRKNTPSEVRAIKGDFEDTALLKDVLIGHRIDAVIHMAASIEVAESMLNPIPYFDNNTYHTHTLVKTMLENGVKKIIFSSTAAVYGYQEEMPIRENTTVNPMNAYGYSKLAAEQMLNFYNRYAGLDAIIFRFFNACGSDYDKTIYSTHSSHLIHNILEVAAGRKQDIEIFGNDYPTTDGTAVRDYVHVLDIARAHVLAIDYFERQHPHVSVFNIGTGSGYTNMEVLNAAREVTGHPIPVRIGSRRPGDIPISIADNSKIVRELHFAPRHSDIKTIIETSWH